MNRGKGIGILRATASYELIFCPNNTLPGSPFLVTVYCFQWDRESLLSTSSPLPLHPASICHVVYLHKEQHPSKHTSNQKIWNSDSGFWSEMNEWSSKIEIQEANGTCSCVLDTLGCVLPVWTFLQPPTLHRNLSSRKGTGGNRQVPHSSRSPQNSTNNDCCLTDEETEAQVVEGHGWWVPERQGSRPRLVSKSLICLLATASQSP